MTASTWRRVRLKELGTWFGGGTPSKSNLGFWTNGTVPWLSPKDMGPEVLADTQDHITEDAVQSSSVRRVPAGSVALVVRSGILERILPVTLVPFDTTLNQDMKAVVPRPDIDARWIAWGLRASEQEILRTCRKAGTTVASMEMPRLFEHTLPLPPLDEQRRIVDILEDHLSRLDAASGYLSAGGLRCAQLRNSALVRMWDKASSLCEAVPVDTIGRVVTGSTPSTRQGDPFNGVVPFLTPSDVGRGGEVTLWSRTLSEQGALQARTVGPNAVVAVCIGATLGKVGWVDHRVASNQQINAVDLDPAVARAPFIASMMASPIFHRQMITEASSTTMPILNKSRFSRLSLPLPDLAAQDRLLVELDDLSAAGQRARQAVSDVEREAAGLRMALLGAAFSGRLTGRTSDMEMVEEMAGV